MPTAQGIKGYHHFSGKINGADLAGRITGNNPARRFRFKKEGIYETTICGTSYRFSRVLYNDFHDEEGEKRDGITALSRRALQVYETIEANGEWSTDVPADEDADKKKKKRKRVSKLTKYRLASQLENAALAFVTTHAFREDRVCDWDYQILMTNIARLGYAGLMVVRRHGRRLTKEDFEGLLGIVRKEEPINGKVATSSS